jgi:Tol biopolymer transport system component
LRRIALIATLALVLVAVPASALDPGETVLVTQTTGGAAASGIDTVNLSSDGRCAVFNSNDAALPQANGSWQIYLRDTEAGTTTLVSQSPGGAAGDDDSRNPVITPDCRYVAWDSEAHNLVADAQTQRLVYRRDLQTGTNVLISQGDGADGVIPNSAGGAFVPRMSADGNVVAFATRATNLSDEDTDTNGNTDVFVRVVSTDHTELVSRTFTDAGITGSQGAGFYTSISADGRYVAFDT